MSKRRSVEVLGPAPLGFGCALCGRSGHDMVQIAMSRGRIGLWHRDCAAEYFRAPIVEPTKPKVAAAVLDRKHE